jgi:hypothetical protein
MPVQLTPPVRVKREYPGQVHAISYCLQSVASQRRALNQT